MRENRRQGTVLGGSGRTDGPPASCPNLHSPRTADFLLSWSSLATFSFCPCADCVPVAEQLPPQTIPLLSILTIPPKHPYSGQDFLVSRVSWSNSWVTLVTYVTGVTYYELNILLVHAKGLHWPDVVLDSVSGLNFTGAGGCSNGYQ